MIGDYKQLTRHVEATYDELASYYTFFYPFPSEENDRFIEALDSLLSSYNVERILDINCGVGRHIIPLARLGYEVVGADVSEGMLRQARRFAREFGVEGRVKLVKAEWKELPEKVEGEFDAILGLGNPLEHIPPEHRADVLRNVNELLRRGGFLLLSRRNWEWELGLKGDRTLYVRSLRRRMPSPWGERELPFFSPLYGFSVDDKEIITFFTYHNYGETSREHVYHVLEYDLGKGGFNHKSFRLKAFYVFKKALRDDIIASGFKEIRLITSLKRVEYDPYTLNEFWISVK